MLNNAEIGKRIKMRREQLDLTQEELGKRVFMNKSTIQRYETGKIQTIKVPYLHAIAKALDVNPDWLILKTDKITPFVPHNEWYNRNNGNYSIDEITTEHIGVKIPVLGSVPAGIPIEAIEDILDYEEITPEMAHTGEFFALRIKGSSMEPKISEGDVVIIQRQEQVENGEIAVVMINGNDATVKKFYKSPAGVQLIGTNPSFTPIVYTPKEVEQLPVRVIGKVVELRAKF